MRRVQRFNVLCVSFISDSGSRTKMYVGTAGIAEVITYDVRRYDVRIDKTVVRFLGQEFLFQDIIHGLGESVMTLLARAIDREEEYPIRELYTDIPIKNLSADDVRKIAEGYIEREARRDPFDD